MTWASQSRGNTRGQYGSNLPCYHKATGPNNLQDVCCTEETAQPEDPTHPLSVTTRSTRAQIGNLGRWGKEGYGHLNPLGTLWLRMEAALRLGLT